MPSTRTIKLAGATNRSPEVARAATNFLRWVKENHPGSYASTDVQADPELLNYLLLGTEGPASTLSFFQGALSVFLSQEEVEVS